MRIHLVFRQLIAISLGLMILSSNFSAWAADPTPPTVNTSTVQGTREPLIEVSVDTLEISETNTNNFGVTWGQSGGNDTNTGRPILDSNHLNFAESSVPSLFEVGRIVRTPLLAQLQALVQTGQARILANPTLLTKSGFEANFLVGGELPYPTSGQGGVGGVEFKKYGVSLKILPQTTPRQTIDAQINVAVSNPDASVARVIQGSPDPVPGLSAREAGTKVEVKDGETVVIAGIKQSRREKVVTRVPILGYIPLIGLLFRSKSETVVQTSLVFFVTFHFVK